MFDIITIIPFAGLALIGAGYFIKRNINKLLIIAGYTLFSSYWLAQVPYFIKVNDFANALFCSLALPFFAYISNYEFISFNRKENVRHLRFLAGWVFFAGLIYFSIEKIPFLTENLIRVCAGQSVALVNTFGYNYYVGTVSYYPELSFPIEETHQNIMLILACTGIQSIAIFTGAIICAKAQLKRKIYAFFATAPVIWFLNLVRNAGIIYGDSIGIDVNFAHNYIGKIGSLIALIALAFLVFKLLPEIYDDTIALFELTKRRGLQKE
jgi:archaeosortase A (PGF-CTERM-specific)